MSKYVRVMDGLKSNAGGFNYKLNEVNVSEKWDTSTLEPEKMGGFNFCTEDKILRWLHRGDTIYDVIIPEDAEIVLCEEEKGIYRANKIIVTNPREITDELVIELYNKTTLSDKIIAQCLVTLLWKKRKEISKYIIRDRVNLNNIGEILSEFTAYAGEDNVNSETGKEIYEILKEIESDVLISLYIDKEPYERILTNDKIINLTGQSGSGKTTYAKEHFNNSEYLIIDTDDIFSEKRFSNSSGINKELGEMFRDKYETLPNLADDFDLIYQEIINYCKNIDKTIVIDCAQFHCIKNIDVLKGKIVVLRTCIENCYNRCLKRYDMQYPNATEEDKKNYAKRKLAIYQWYKFTNKFLEKISSIE